MGLRNDERRQRRHRALPNEFRRQPGKHRRPLPNTIHLAPDVRRYVPGADAVNAALRGFIALVPTQRRTRQRKAQAEKN